MTHTSSLCCAFWIAKCPDSKPASMAQLDVLPVWSSGPGFDPCQLRQYSFIEIDHEIFSLIILSLLLIQEGKLSVFGRRMCIGTGKLLRGLSLPRKSVIK